MNEDGRREPRRSTVPPRRGSDPPEPVVFGEPVDFGQGQKHPSDYWADCAVGALIRAQQTEDTIKRGQELQVSEVASRLAHRDAVLEFAAVVKEVAKTEIAAVEELSATMKKAANVIYAEVRRATVKPAPESEAESA